MKIIVFENDEEFEMFAMKPNLVVKTSEKSGTLYYDIELSDEYFEAVNEGTLFYIKDRNSKVKKRKVVKQRLASKPVQNIIEGWYGWDCDDEYILSWNPQCDKVIHYGE